MALLIPLALFVYYAAASSICPENIIRYNQTIPEVIQSRSIDNVLGQVDLQRYRHSIIPQTDMDVPWKCDQTTIFRDLGEGFFPRYIKEKRCMNATCYYGHYVCRPALMTVKVLTMNTQHCRDPTLPYSLKRLWLYTNVEVAAYCQCSRH